MQKVLVLEYLSFGAASYHLFFIFPWVIDLIHLVWKWIQQGYDDGNNTWTLTNIYCFRFTSLLLHDVCHTVFFIVLIRSLLQIV